MLLRCHCCKTCTIHTDDFGDGTITDFAQVSGTWSEGSGEISTASSNAILISDKAHPDTEISMVASARFKHSTNGSSCYIIVGYQDSSNFWYARFTAASGSGGSVAIRKVVSGTHSTVVSQSTVTINANTFYTGKICISQGGNLTLTLNGTVLCGTNSPQTITGYKAGLGTTGSGTATFDDFSFKKVSHDITNESCEVCAGPPCALCVANYGSNYLLVRINNLTRSDPSHLACCDDWDDIEIEIPRKIPPTTSGDCQWELVIADSSVPCTDSSTPADNYFHYAGAILRLDAGTYRLRVSISKIGNPGVSYFIDLGSSLPDCEDLAGLDIPYEAPNQSVCDSTASTCTLVSFSAP